MLTPGLELRIDAVHDPSRALYVCGETGKDGTPVDLLSPTRFMFICPRDFTAPGAKLEALHEGSPRHVDL